MSALNARVASSDLAVFASPTYKATYTGLLKAFLDRYPANGLAGVTAIPVHTGGDLTHAMGPTVNLAPLLVELGAVVPGRGFYFVAGQMDHLDDLVEAAAAEYAANLSRLATVAAATAQGVTA
jgi:FMN reductase